MNPHDSTKQNNLKFLLKSSTFLMVVDFLVQGINVYYLVKKPEQLPVTLPKSGTKIKYITDERYDELLEEAHKRKQEDSAEGNSNSVWYYFKVKDSDISEIDSDQLYGDDGRDVILGGRGNDQLIGTAGNDMFEAIDMNPSYPAYLAYDRKQRNFEYKISQIPVIIESLISFAGKDLNHAPQRDSKRIINLNIEEIRDSLKEIISDEKIINDVCNRLYDADLEKSQLVSQTSSVKPIPEEAPEMWVDRKPEDKTPAHFITRVYGPWLTQMHTGHIRDRDPTLGRALDRWIEGGKKGEPEEGFHLASKAEALARRPRMTDEERRHASALLSRDHRAKKRDRGMS